MVDPVSQPPDWEAIEREYRAGALSLREIGRQHGVSEGAIRKRARSGSWNRALAERVREAVREKLVRADSTQPGTQSDRVRDSEIVEGAAGRGVSVVLRHRRDIGRLADLRTILADRLAAHLDGAPVMTIGPDGEAVPGPCLGERETPAQLLGQLARVTAQIIPLERQAFGLDAPAEIDPARAPTVPTLEELRARKLEWARSHGSIV